ncbi:MAG: hypothetical protein LBJ84_05225, partial [Oscillospiraceae bacterium]|nr:hypothetical protein [Oscillospiraceae bacterium]
MIFGKSLKQLLRTPVTTALFMALFAVAAFFVSGGAVIWARNQSAIKTYEDTFITIGTVRQRATSMEITKRWDALIKDYTRRSAARYAAITSPSVLGFDGADYILGPEKRPYYGAWRPDLRLMPEEDPNWSILATYVVELTPLEDCVPDGPVEARIERVLSETPGFVSSWSSLQKGGVVFLCDHYNDSPQPLYAGKTYLMYLANGGMHDPQNVASPTEWRPQSVVFSTQCRPDGSRIEASVTTPAIVEVADGFYETELGRCWLEFAGAIHSPLFTLPVLPTTGTRLLLPFYNETANIVAGEDLTPKEYETGDYLCLIPENFAKRNGISLGDALRLPLYYANYENAPNGDFADYNYPSASAVSWGTIHIENSPLTADGKPYPIFSDHEYIVKGIYSCAASSDAALSMGGAVVIPAASVRESDENNIRAYGPMKDATAAFQIPNGTIEAYMEKWLAQGNDELEITFRDKGYTQLRRGLENMKQVSVLFLAIGAAMSLALVFFFCHVFISKNKLRTAIERMLGFTKAQCAASLLSGFLLAAAVSTVIGCAAGLFAEGQITDKL